MKYWINLALFGKPQESEMVREYFTSVYKKQDVLLSPLTSVMAFGFIPILAAIFDTSSWTLYNVFKTPYLWLLVAFNLFYGIYLLRKRKRVSISISELYLYYANSSGITLLFCIIIGVRTLIISGEIQLIIINIISFILLGLFFVIIAVRLVKLGVVIVNRKKVKHKTRKERQYGKVLVEYSGIIGVLIGIIILQIMTEGRSEQEQTLYKILYMFIFCIFSFITCLLYYVRYLLIKFDCIDINV